MVCNTRHDAGGVGCGTNDQESRVLGFHHGLVVFDWISDRPHGQHGNLWRDEDGCVGPEQKVADLWSKKASVAEDGDLDVKHVTAQVKKNSQSEH